MEHGALLLIQKGTELQDMENTAKNFALQLGSLISLYISIGSLITLLLSVITIIYPDQASYYWEQESASASIRIAIAILIVFFPTYILLTRLVNNIRRIEHGVYLTLTKWLIYLSLLVGGGVLLGDLVAVIMSFLNGELSIRFVLKALTILLVVTTAFLYYLADARGYWQTHEKESIRYAMVVAVCVIGAIVFGFLHTQSPAEVRAINLDRNQITDLQNIQSHIESYSALNGTLPLSLNDAFNGLAVPTAPDTRNAYTYTKKSSSSFSLCAEFAYPSITSTEVYATPVMKEPYAIKNPNNWDYSAGIWCFERALNANPTLPPV